MESFVLLNATFICQRRDHMRISHIIDTHTQTEAHSHRHAVRYRYRYTQADTNTLPFGLTTVRHTRILAVDILTKAAKATTATHCRQPIDADICTQTHTHSSTHTSHTRKAIHTHTHTYAFVSLFIDQMRQKLFH